MGFFRKVRKYLKDEKGQSVTEYILILSVVVLIAVKFKQTIGDKIKSATDKVGQDIQSVLDMK